MKIICALLFILFAGCQQKPTQVMEESVNVFAENTVLVDTRGSFEFASYHITGTVSLISDDFLILKNPLTRKRIFDPDLTQTIERLAHKGISPRKRVILLSNQAQSDENKKWQWLFKNIEIEDVTLMSIDQFKKMYPNRQFGEPDRVSVWSLQTSDELQIEFIFKKAPDCFVKWSEKKCKQTF
ncbi:MAG: hypothetical protein H7235_09470 [Bdellovibrionaceae bacterium]|nr:hypothetical protein [Pseudobdellovibrionaceae bacterium]